jgi:hypothetical protein
MMPVLQNSWESHHKHWPNNNKKQKLNTDEVRKRFSTDTPSAASWRPAKLWTRIVAYHGAAA